MHVIWEEFLKIIKEEAGSQIVETWFKAVTLEEWNPTNCTVTLRVPNQFVSNWIQEHYVELLKKHLARLLHSDTIRLFFLCAMQDAPKRNIIPASMAHATLLDQPKQPKTHHKQFPTREDDDFYAPQVKPGTKITVSGYQQKKPVSSNLNSNYTFETFIVGPSNSLAHAAAHAVAENIAAVYNPLYVYGGTGLGKTHLLHAIGNAAQERHPGITVRYETCDRFINEFIHSIRLDKTLQFREKYQKIDLLLLDDIQFLSNKEQTQESFFHIFNSLYEQEKQIILSSDTFPKEIKGLQSRLKSRMEWGLVADIQMPDLETKIAILERKAEAHTISLPDDVANFIAARVVSNIRELEGALIRISAFANLTNQPISLDMARKVLLNLNDDKKKDGVMLENVLKGVAKHFAVSVNDIKSKKRHKAITRVRQVTFYLMKKMTFCSLQTIGSYIGGRDHSTVIHAISKVDDLMKQERSFYQKLKKIEQEILMN